MRLFPSAAANKQRHAATHTAMALPFLLLGIGGPSLVEAGYQLDTSSTDSIRSIARSMAADMMSFYNGNELGNTPGLLPKPYYWWEAGAMMGALIDYWYYTGDSTYNALASQGLLFQVGPNNDYMPPNQTLTEGNDDQGFWGLSVMTAAEYNFPNPPADKPQWLALAQAVFNTQVARWDAADCGGGLRWQIFTWNNGYDYKNAISQACFFNLAARLALYTGNQTYADWAQRTWDWVVDIKIIDEKYYVYDGGHIKDNCSTLTPYQFSYNAGAFLLGAAAMYNYTATHGDNDAQHEAWRGHVDGLLNGSHVFFTGKNSDIMTEVACEPVHLCDLDQQSFKAYLSRWMAATTKWAPWTAETVLPLIRSSSVAAASQCSGGSNGRMCGLRWTDDGEWDNSTGVGQQMAAMEVTLANLIGQAASPVTNSSGGTSQGSSGGSEAGRTDPSAAHAVMRPITAGDRAGAAILTVAVLLSLVGGIVLLLWDEATTQTPKERWQSFVGGVKDFKSGKGVKGVEGVEGSGNTGVGDQSLTRAGDSGVAISEKQPGEVSKVAEQHVNERTYYTTAEDEPAEVNSEPIVAEPPNQDLEMGAALSSTLEQQARISDPRQSKVATGTTEERSHSAQSSVGVAGVTGAVRKSLIKRKSVTPAADESAIQQV